MQEPKVDDKKETIEKILPYLRLYNPYIGSYRKSILIAGFRYYVLLSNGHLILPQELIHDFEKDPQSISEDRLKAAAGEFLSR